MATLERFGVVEYVRDGLPVRVTIHSHDAPLEPREGESIRWLLSDLDLYTAMRLAAFRSRQIVRWSGDAAPWLQSYVLRLPSQPDDIKGRRVVCIDGEQRRLYRSLKAAARHENTDRTVIRRRLADGRADARGRLWTDAAQPWDELCTTATLESART
jgi:hypothetical protein